MISQADGLSDNRIFAVVPDDVGHVWLDSAIGLQRIPRQSVDDFADGISKRVDCETFGGKESIKFVDRDDQAFVGCKTTDGHIWFPNPHGLIMVDPENYFRNRVQPAVSIEKAIIADRDFADPLISKARTQNGSVEFFFSAHELIAPKKIRVRYQLEHFDEQWIEAGDNRSVTYQHLSPGTFIFHVQAANEDSVWNTEGDSFSLDLLPPFYRRLWFYGLIGISVPLGVFRLYSRKERQAQARQKELQFQNQVLESNVGHRTKQLDRSLSLLTATLESTPDGVLAIHSSDGSATWNSQLVAMWGLPKEMLQEKVGITIVGYMANLVRDAESFVRRVETGVDAFDSNSLDIVELEDGRIFEVHCRQQYLNGRGSGIVLHFRDVTERKRIEGALRSNEERLKAMFEQAAVGVAQIELRTGRFVQVNQHLCDILGRSRDEMGNTTIADIAHSHEKAAQSEKMKIIGSGSSRESTWEGRYLRKDGSSIWMNMTVSAMWRPEKAPDFVIAVAQDISNRKRLEDQLRQAQKMEAIGTLAGGIAHDFNNILSIIKGYTELAVLELKERDEVSEHLKAVRVATSRATDLVRQILTFSRQQTHERRPIFLAPIVAETLKLLRATIPSTVEFKPRFETDVPAILADATQIHQIVMNLGTNAWQAMKGQPGSLEVVLERFVVDAYLGAIQPRLKPGIYARMSVSDTGCGMDHSTLGRIFEPFFSTKPPGEGTGLGLAVVHGIMEAHDGAITAYSSPGEGTTFRLFFPEFLGAADVDDAQENTVPRGNGERILLIDDEDLLSKLGQQMLLELGYDAVTTTQPRAALEMFEADPERFMLVVTDQTMPSMTGLDLALRIRKIRRRMPIILMTGNSLSITSERRVEAGISQVLLKPISLISLGTAVKNALKSASVSATGDRSGSTGRS